MHNRFEPIKEKCGQIVDWFMNSPDMPDDEQLLFKIRLSIEEVVENIVNYAYIGGAGYLETEIRLVDNNLIITLTDSGKAFDPLAKPDPDTSLDLEHREIGGLGIFLCKQMMDSVSYRYENGCNILTLQKRIK